MDIKRKVNWRSELRIFALWYAGAFSVGFMALMVFLLINILPIVKETDRIWRFVISGASFLLKAELTYLFPLVVYVLFVLIRSLVRNFKTHRWAGLSRGIALKVLLPGAIIWGYLFVVSLYRTSESFDYTWDTSVQNPLPHTQNLYEVDGKFRGMHLFDLSADSSELVTLNENNIEWLTFVPYISQEVYSKPPEEVSIDSTWVRRRFDTMASNNEALKPYGFNVMLKPHIWLQQRPGNTWRSDIQMANEADWDGWFSYYSAHMLMYASIAERLGFEMLCIGTELHRTVVEQPEKWHTLINQIQDVYPGKLVYAANWSDNLDEIPFWDEMDYIGIQAYFPIADRDNPDLEELEAGWQARMDELKELSETYNKPILFTEIGYKSTPDAAKTPWEWERPSYWFYKRISHKTQAQSYEAFFNVVWPEPWFAGAFIWHWSADSGRGGENHRFTLRDKPALNVVAKGFAAPSP